MWVFAFENITLLRGGPCQTSPPLLSYWGDGGSIRQRVFGGGEIFVSYKYRSMDRKTPAGLMLSSGRRHLQTAEPATKA